LEKRARRADAAVNIGLRPSPSLVAPTLEAGFRLAPE
jgi:hypothetical protein